MGDGSYLYLLFVKLCLFVQMPDVLLILLQLFTGSPFFLGVEVYRQEIAIICQAFDESGVCILNVSEFRFLWKHGLADTTIRQYKGSNSFFQFQYMCSDGRILQYRYDISCFHGFTVFPIYLLNFPASSCHDPYGWMFCSNGDFGTYDIRIFKEAAPNEE